MSGHIEFVGAPGTGKTTLVAWLAGRRVRIDEMPHLLIPIEHLHRVVRSGRDRAHDVPLTYRTLMVTARSSILQRSLVRWDPQSPSVEVEGRVAALRAAVGDLPAGDVRAEPWYRDQAFGWLDETLGLLERAGALEPRVVPLLAEGVAQRALSILGTSAAPSATLQVLEALPVPRLVIHLHAGTASLADRAARRRRLGIEPVLHRGLTLEAVIERIAADAAALARIVRQCALMGVPIIDVEPAPESGPRRIGREVLQRIATELGGAPVSTGGRPG